MVSFQDPYQCLVSWLSPTSVGVLGLVPRLFAVITPTGLSCLPCYIISFPFYLSFPPNPLSSEVCVPGEILFVLVSFPFME